MVKEHSLVCGAGPRILALAAAALVLYWSMPVAGAADQQVIVIGNTSLCSSINVDGTAEDGGCLSGLTIAGAQPELEGVSFEMASDMGSAVLRRRLGGYGDPRTGDKAACVRDKYGRYTPCTTPPGRFNPKYSPFNRENK